jgi:creatinine amidohydrolase/Fe(II)-dependent formamide hydrolase-like protein
MRGQEPERPKAVIFQMLSVRYRALTRHERIPGYRRRVAPYGIDRAPMRLIALLFLSLSLGVGYARAEPVEMAHMTWIEIRQAIAQGAQTVIVPTGGTEANGPQMALDKHNRIVGYAAVKIAERVGNTLVAPVVPIVLEGRFDPPDGDMKYPGPIGVSDKTFEALLTDIARSLRLAGFRTILFIGDHGHCQKPQMNVAERLTREWRIAGVRVFHVAAYYDDAKQTAMLKAKGETDNTIGFHARLVDTSELSFIHPGSVYPNKLNGLSAPLGALGASGAPGKVNAAQAKATDGDLRLDTGKMARHYTRAADRKRLAQDATQLLLPAQTTSKKTPAPCARRGSESETLRKIRSLKNGCCQRRNRIFGVRL